MNISDGEKSAEDLYKEAYKAFENNDRDNLLKICRIIHSRFPTSREADWTKQNFGLIVDDLDLHKKKHESKIILTTAPFIDGYRVTNTIDIITSECVYGINILKDFVAGFQDVVGGRVLPFEKVLSDARKVCLTKLKRQAADIEADAVIAVKLDYGEISGGGKTMFSLVASGTAVQIKQFDTEHNNACSKSLKADSH